MAEHSPLLDAPATPSSNNGAAAAGPQAAAAALAAVASDANGSGSNGLGSSSAVIGIGGGQPIVVPPERLLAEQKQRLALEAQRARERDNHARVAAITASGFDDADGGGNGSTPPSSTAASFAAGASPSPLLAAGVGRGALTFGDALDSVRGSEHDSGAVTPRGGGGTNGSGGGGGGGGEKSMWKEFVTRLQSVKLLRQEPSDVADEYHATKHDLHVEHGGSRVRAAWTLVKKRWRYYVPVTQWLPHYSYKSDLKSDLLAGLSIGVMLLPQGIAYSSLANLPPIYGLYTAFFGCLVYFLFGSSRHISIGPESTSSILIGQAVLSLPWVDQTTAPEQLAEYALSLTLLIGLTTLLLGVFRLGFIDSILSRPVLTAFVFAVAGILLIDQTPKLLGLPPCDWCGAAPSTVDKIAYLFGDLPKANGATIAVSVFCLAFLLGHKALKARVPESTVWGRRIAVTPIILIVVVLATFFSWVLKLSDKGVPVLHNVRGGFITPHIPPMDLTTISDLLAPAITISILGFIVTQVVSKKYAQKYNYTVSANRELIALGVVSFVGSFFGAYSAYGSLPRSRVNETAGCKTQMSGLFGSVLVLFTILFLMPAFADMPKCVGASIVSVAAIGIVEVDEFKFIWRMKSYKEMVLMFAMILITVLLGVDVGIFFALGICLLLVVKQTTLPGVTLLGRSDKTSDFQDVSVAEFEAKQIEGMLIYKLDGPLYFANSQKLKDSFQRIETFGDLHAHPSQQTNPLNLLSVIFDMTGLTTIDSSASQTLRDIIEHYHANGVTVCLVKVREDIRKKFGRAGIFDAVPESHLFHSLADAVRFSQSHAHHLRRARADPNLIAADDAVAASAHAAIGNSGSNGGGDPSDPNAIDLSAGISPAHRRSVSVSVNAADEKQPLRAGDSAADSSTPLRGGSVRSTHPSSATGSAMATAATGSALASSAVAGSSASVVLEIASAAGVAPLPPAQGNDVSGGGRVRAPSASYQQSGGDESKL